MKYLLDVNVLLAGIWAKHPRNAEAFEWLKEKSLVVCPISELGFLRISSNPRVFNAPMHEARNLLEEFLSERAVERIPDDLPALDAHAKSSDEVTDLYLAELSARHNLKLATLDENISHHAVELIAKKATPSE